MSAPMGIRLFCFLLAAALVLWGGTGLAGDDGPNPPQHSVGAVISVGGDHAYPPYEYLDGGTATGFNIELILAVAEVMGIRMEVALGPWQDVRRRLEEGQVHVLAGMHYSEERAKEVAFSVPHTMVSSGLFVRRGSVVRGLDDLGGREVLVQEGDIMHDYLLSSPMDVRAIPVQDPVEALLLLSDGNHDAALLSSRVQGMFFVNRLGLDNLTSLETGLPAREYCFAVAKGNEQLIHRLNEGLSIIKEDNRYRRIHDDWFGVYEAPGTWHKAWPYLRPLMFVLAVLALAGFAWSWTLRRTVARRTGELAESREYLQRYSLELQDSQRRLQVILSNLPGMAYRCRNDRDWTMEFVSEGCLPLCGYRSEELIGNAVVSFNSIIHPEHRERVWETWQDALRLKQKLTIEYVIVCRDGTEKWVWEQGLGVFTEGGELPCLEGFIADISDRKRAEEEREKLNAQLRQAQKMESVGTMAGGIAHDFNNLLQAMSGNIQLLLMRDNDETVAARLHNVAQSIDRASRLVRQLLQFSRKAVVERQWLNLNHAVEDATRMIERTIPKMVSMELRLQNGLWPVMADPVQIEQVLLNLASNSADAMPHGGRFVIETHNVTLDDEFVRMNAEAKTGEHVLLAVSDNGHGMDEDVLKHIFDPFFTTKEVGRGTGLGLASVYGIVQSHGGYIQCDSKPGLGTVFRIYWPAANAVEAMEYPGRFPVVPDDRIAPGGGETILVVDDDEHILALTRETLEDLGYIVVTASCGEDALAVYAEKAEEIAMIILDLGMPGMGGRQCLRELLNIDSDARILIASGYAESEMIEEIRQSGAAGFLGKPYRLNDLAARVREVLDGSRLV